ncbi:methylation-associated defense system restriction endonuclease subunit S MAD5 [Chryseobacterium sp. SC28]|uniref:methylation-associated defense system restriction endonuclease subunit S MAD5 n=1 Tax=Chryseobacterium sp. SC28 TaxID=2268028 RepID=UPI000F64BC19|nr:restriction endonuclease subunit S [Chryseobacterium sp. SC28]RRQ45676.1 restriction endonuclease subunit S [Chryseobacterium sp. SC28]
MIIQKIKKQQIVESLRFDGSYHLSDGTLYLRKLRKMPHQELQSLCSDIFTAGRSKRIYTEKNKGFPYLSNSDVVKGNPLDGCKYNSKKYAFDEPSFLKEGMIVTGRVGAIGQTAYITSELEDNQAMGSDNIIRIVCKDKNISGYVYSFLTSKYGNTLINRLAAGGVQPYISEDMLKDIPIPILSAETQQKIHQLIVEASELRVEANRLLKEAAQIFEQELNYGRITDGAQYGKISSKDLLGFHKRLDGQYQLIWKKIKKEYNPNIQFEKIENFASSIFVGGRGKRNYVENGIPFLSSSDMMLYNPKRQAKKISPSTNGVEQMKVSKRDILISRSGTVGNTVIVGEDLNNTVISEHALRLKVNSEKISPNYVFAFLKTNMGLKAMEASAFGSVIITLNEELIGNIDLPILSNELQRVISEKIEEFISLSDKSVIKENQAIALIEKEIDLWQVS